MYRAITEVYLGSMMKIAKLYIDQSNFYAQLFFKPIQDDEAKSLRLVYNNMNKRVDMLEKVYYSTHGG